MRCSSSISPKVDKPLKSVMLDQCDTRPMRYLPSCQTLLPCDWYQAQLAQDSHFLAVEWPAVKLTAYRVATQHVKPLHHKAAPKAKEGNMQHNNNNDNSNKNRYTSRPVLSGILVDNWMTLSEENFTADYKSIWFMKKKVQFSSAVLPMAFPNHYTTIITTIINKKNFFYIVLLSPNIQSNCEHM